MAVKDPQNYKLRGIRMHNELWDIITELAEVNGRSASKEVVVALKDHIARAKKRGAIK